MKEILLRNHTKYPHMQVQDAVKLLYQSEFGGGHMIADAEKSLARIRAEAIENTGIDNRNRQNLINKEPYESIGNGICRLYLSALEEGLRPETLNQMFVWTAEQKKGTIEQFEAKLAVLLDGCRKGELPWQEEEVCAYLKEYKKQGYPAVSHSVVYRKQYQPSYRIVAELFIRYYSVILKIDQMLEEHQNDDHTMIVAIDGMCGAGKSTLGQLLTEIYDCNLFHMDEFFLRMEQRTAKRYEEPGGNVDYERFKEEILDHITDEKGLRYQVFECSKKALGAYRQVPHKKLNIIEGSYSHHPYFGDRYDLKVFCKVEPEEQLRRIEARNGSEMLEMFKSRWIPLENRYLDAFEIEKNSDVIV